MSNKCICFGLCYREQTHISNITKKRGHYAKKKCICPKGEKNEDIANDFFAYVQMQKNRSVIPAEIQENGHMQKSESVMSSKRELNGHMQNKQ